MLATAELSAKARRAAAGVYVESLLGLDKAWREFVGKTRQSAGEIVFAAAAYWAGEEVATTVEGNLELLHRLRYEDYVAAQRGFGRR
jgi:hypothetical protein